MGDTRRLQRYIKGISEGVLCICGLLGCSKWSIDRIIGWAGLPDDFKAILEEAKNMLASVPAWALPAGLTAFAILFAAVGLERLTASNAEGKTLWQTLTARARGTRADCRERLLRDLKQLSTAYQEFESDKQSPRSTGTAARIWNLSRKHADLLAPVADDEGALAVEFCIGILETEDDFTEAMEIIKERLEKPFIKRIGATFTAGSPTMSARVTVVKAPFYRRILYKIRRLLGLSPIPVLTS